MIEAVDPWRDQIVHERGVLPTLRCWAACRILPGRKLGHFGRAERRAPPSPQRPATAYQGSSFFEAS
jgi:hypothetical protein